MDMPDEPGPPIGELIERWVAGDAAAGAEIYRRYYTRVWRFGLRLTGREIEAEDVAQNAMAEGLEGIKGGKRPDKFTGWILGIVRHAVNRDRDRPRVWTRDPRQFHQSAAPRDSRVIRSEMDRVLKGAMADLNPRERDLLQMRFVERLNRDDVAKRLGVTGQKFDRELDRLLARLRSDLSRHFTTLVLPDVLPAAPERGRVTIEAIDKLRPSFKQSVIARHLEKAASAEEAAQALDIPVETLLARLRAAYATLGCGSDADFSAAREAHQRRKPPKQWTRAKPP